MILEINWYASSTCQDNQDKYGVKFLNDGVVSTNETNIYKSKDEDITVLQADLTPHACVKRVVLYLPKPKKYWKYWEDVEIRICHANAVKYPHKMRLCPVLTRLSPITSNQIIIDGRGMYGRYLYIRKASKGIMALSEVYIQYDRTQYTLPGIHTFYNGMKWWGSSTYRNQDRTGQGVHKLFDETPTIYHTNNQKFDFIQIEFEKKTRIWLLKILNRPDNYQFMRWQNIEIRVGDSDCKDKFKGKLITDNALCVRAPKATDPKPIFLNCNGMAGRYLTIQKTAPAPFKEWIINIEEVYVNAISKLQILYFITI